MEYVIFCTVAVVITILVVTCCRRQMEASVGFSPQPCISDEEFCELMPDVPDEVALKVRCVLVDASGWDRDEIHPNTRLVEFELW